MSTDIKNPQADEIEKKDASKAEKKRGTGILSKLKSIKHFEWIIAGVLIAVLLLVYAGVSGAAKKGNGDAAAGSTYQDKLEAGLEEVLSEIKGVGKVKVMVSYTEAPVEVGKKTQTFGKDDELSEVKAALPEILGVIVVAEGAEDPKVKFTLRQAVMTALKIESNKITIYPMK